ncbi:MAG TPA: methionine adenosyltransferase [Candidatus Saccharimonadales bacterium]|nr:methionine adenosyltransferase [Candidatus Saccharimonadales bacterium]
MSKTITHFASESVCAGHPDKVADQISDAIVDAVLAADPNGRTAVETLVAHDRIVLAGEISTTAKIDAEAIAREQIKRLGYTEPKWGFSDQSPIENYLHQQSPEIAVGVDNDGAGDQGLMFGYASNETPEYLPLPIALAHALTKAIDEARETDLLSYLRPDGKAQVVVRYEDDKPVAVEHVTVAVPHDEDITLETVSADIYTSIITPVLETYGLSVSKDAVVVNGTGVWYTPGPSSDSGLTGRKIVVDGYGGYARVGGGAFSGKDPSKVDRSGAYAARYIAKNIVAAGLADKAEVALAYYIGAKAPVNFSIDTFGTGKKPQAEIEQFAHELLTPSVKNIVKTLDLKRPIYLQTAAYGHFGKSNLPWEQVVAEGSTIKTYEPADKTNLRAAVA